MYCRLHARDSIVNVKSGRCAHGRPDKQSSIAPEASKVVAHLGERALNAPRCVRNTRYPNEGCSEHAELAPTQNRVPSQRKQHLLSLSTTGKNKRSTHEYCRTPADIVSMGRHISLPGSQHGPDDLVDFSNERPAYGSCSEQPRLGPEVNKVLTHSGQRASNGEVYTASKNDVKDHFGMSA